MPANRPRPLLASIVCLAVLTAALGPSIGHAIAAIRDLPVLVAELCSANRHDRVATRAPVAADTTVPARSDGPARRGGAVGAHCPACLGPADPWGPPPSKAPSFARAATPPGTLPALAEARASASSPWTPVNPRAPPDGT
ncbi:MAG: DUF2946 family protein [Anaerolineae bacterium]|nr:DUF2946 family protein [Anaerolineae bacterium]